MALSIIAIVYISFSPINILYCLIPFSVFFVGSTVFEYKSESFYNEDIRIKEKENYHAAYEKYINSIKQTLELNGINNQEKIALLKKECLSALEKHEKKFSLINKKIFDLLVGAPLGTLITLLIHRDESVIVNDIILVIVLGVSLIYTVKLFKTISFYSEGYLKDRQLLDVLEEIEYAYSQE